MEQDNPFGKLMSPGAVIASYALSAFLLLMGLMILYNVWAAKNAASSWAKTEAKVVRTYVETSGGKGRIYNTFIKYAFEANGVTYTSGRTEVYWDDYYRNSADATAAMENGYPIGKTIVVYYDPAAPRRSSLGPAGAPPISPAFLFFALAAAMAYFPTWARRQRSWQQGQGAGSSAQH